METDLSRTITLKRSILIEDDCECSVIPAGTNISFDKGGMADVDCLPISLYRFDERAIGKQHLPSYIGINKILGIRRLYFHGDDMLCHSLYGDGHIENITFGQYGSKVLARKFHSGYMWDEDAFIGKISAIAIDAIEEEVFVSDIPDKFSIKFGVCPTAKDYDELTTKDIGDTIRIDGKWAKLCDFGIGNEMLQKYQAERGRNNKPIDTSFCDNNFNRNVVCAELEGGQLVLCPYGEKATAFFFNRYSRPFAIRVEADMEQIANHKSTYMTIEDYAKTHSYKDSQIIRISYKDGSTYYVCECYSQSVEMKRSLIYLPLPYQCEQRFEDVSALLHVADANNNEIERIEKVNTFEVFKKSMRMNPVLLHRKSLLKAPSERLYLCLYGNHVFHISKFGKIKKLSLIKELDFTQYVIAYDGPRSYYFDDDELSPEDVADFTAQLPANITDEEFSLFTWTELLS